MENKNIKIVQVKISDLKPAIYNPRKWEKDSVIQLSESIKRFGLVDPLIVNSAPKRKNIVIGGHFRLKVAKDLGFKEVPVIYISIPDEEKEKELNLRLNKNLGEWDLELLSKFDKDLLEEIGFSEHTLDAIASNPEEDEFELEAEEVVVKEPRAKLGQVYKLGEHRIMCGDSTKEDHVKKLMGGEEADMVFTDPPYNVAYKSDKLGKIENDDMDEDKFIAFSEAFVSSMKQASKTGAPFYICSGWSSYPSFIFALRQNGFKNSSMIVWVKSSPIFGFGNYKGQHEEIIKTKNPPKAGKKKAQPIAYGWNGGRHYFNETKFEADVWEVKRRSGQTMIHPTQKPLELVRRAILNSSKRNEIVLDLFTGGGSTLIAAEQTSRRAFCMELDPKFVDRVIARWEKLTDKKAVKEA